MKTLYLDCFAGISGDMTVGALLDLGLDIHVLESELDKLHVSGYRLEVSRVDKRGISATQFKVILTDGGWEHIADHTSETLHEHEHDRDAQHQHGHDQENTTSQPHQHNESAHEHRSLTDILNLIERSDLSITIKDRASQIFKRLGVAEASVHGVPVDEVHFHEVGAVDAIVDIVSSVIGIEQLAIQRIVASPLHLGTGFVRMSHGLYPIPAPATALLTAGVPVYATEAKGELVTPTGAAIVTTLADSFGPMPPQRIIKVGYGAGSKDRDFPNVLRAFLGITDDEPARVTRMPRNPHPEQHLMPVTESGYHTGRAIVIEANIDDMNPQFYEALLDQLLAAGALDVVLLPVQMKKQRPGTLLQVIADPASVDSLLQILFRESTTIGARSYEVTRYMLQREVLTVQTIYGAVRVKVARLGNDTVNQAPEYEDCRLLSRQHGVPIKVIYAAALNALAI